MCAISGRNNGGTHMKRHFKNRVIHLSITCAIIGFSTYTLASDFQSPFVNASGLGDLYSGWAVDGNDASASYTNPAALVLIPNQQAVLAAVGMYGNSTFTGQTTPPPPPIGPQVGTASSELRAFLPSAYYALPLGDRVVFGLGETSPFGLGTNYGQTSIVRYSTTKGQIGTVDVGPSLGVKVTDKFSIGAGFDAERLALSFNNMVGAPMSPDTLSQNNMSQWRYGWHGGMLYQFTPSTRVGVNYDSQIVFHPSGESELSGPLIPGGQLIGTDLNSNFTLPAMAQFSASHDFCQQWTIKASILYVNWHSFKQVTVNNILGPGGMPISNTIPFNYHNTEDYTVGLDYKPSDRWTLKTGVYVLNSPSNGRDRIVVDPISYGTIVSLGAHFQQNHYVGYDVGYAHAFFSDTTFNNVTPFNTVTGHSSQQNNVFGGQLTWNIT